MLNSFSTIERIVSQAKLLPNECAVGCLYIITLDQNTGGSIETVRGRFPAHSSDGHSLGAILLAARGLGMTAHAMKLDSFDELQHQTFPLILHSATARSNGHFTIGLGANEHEVAVFDCQSGFRLIGCDNFGQNFSGFVVSFLDWKPLSGSSHHELVDW